MRDTLRIGGDWTLGDMYERGVHAVCLSPHFCCRIEFFETNKVGDIALPMPIPHPFKVLITFLGADTAPGRSVADG